MSLSVPQQPPVPSYSNQDIIDILHRLQSSPRITSSRVRLSTGGTSLRGTSWNRGRSQNNQNGLNGTNTYISEPRYSTRRGPRGAWRGGLSTFRGMTNDPEGPRIRGRPEGGHLGAYRLLVRNIMINKSDTFILIIIIFDVMILF